MTLERRTPIKRKRSKPRRVLTPPELQCANGRCHKLATVLDWCPKHARAEADRLFSIYIRARDHKCMICVGPEGPFNLRLECMHVVGRAHYATRWDPANALAGHNRCHFAMTLNPLRWDAWCTEHFGPETYGALKFKAERGGMPDVGWVIEELHKRTEQAA